jgi:ABC-type polysaccharide/polyol phosphate export permease
MPLPTRIRVLRTSALVALAAGVLAFPFIGIMEFFRSNVSSEPLPKMILVVVPLLMGGVTFVVTLVGCLVYNGLRKRFSGPSTRDA